MVQWLRRVTHNELEIMLKMYGFIFFGVGGGGAEQQGGGAGGGAQWLRRITYTRYGGRTVYTNNAKDVRLFFGGGGGGALIDWGGSVVETS